MAVTKLGTRAVKKPDLNPLLYGKLPPQAPELEAAILGAIMVESNRLSDVLDVIQSPDCFYTDANKRIYAAIRRLFDKGSRIDFITVAEELKKENELELAGGYFYVTSLTKDVVSTANIEEHARIVMQKFIMRELIRLSGDVISEAYEDSSDVFDLLDKAETNLYDITDKHLRKNFNSIGNIVVNTLKEIQEARNKTDDITGIPSGFAPLDRLTGGWQKTDLIILAARPAVGKTAFALNLVMNAAMHKNKPTAVAFFSLEMSAGQLVKRMLSATTQVLLEKISKGNLEDYEVVQIQERMGVLSNAKIFIDDQAALNIFELRAKCRRLKQREGLGFIVIDYLQLMTASIDKGGNREQEISKISRELKALAKELEVPIIALSQLNRGVENRKESKVPQLSDLRESGAIEQDADMVMFLYRPDYYITAGSSTAEAEQATIPGETWINVAKHRNGQTDIIKVKAELQYQKFVDMPTDNVIPSSFGQGGGNTPAVKSSAGMKPKYDSDGPSFTVHNSYLADSKANDMDDKNEDIPPAIDGEESPF
ncbi:MAG: replicative helicase [Bacteroidota bacterium]|jgi:replicative DNA helicase